jgi:hypothetical protein
MDKTVENFIINFVEKILNDDHGISEGSYNVILSFMMKMNDYKHPLFGTSGALMERLDLLLQRTEGCDGRVYIR